MNPVRLGVIGAGNVNRLYLDTIVGCDDLETVVIGDRHTERAEAAAAQYGVPRHGSVEDVLRAADVDVLVNFTSPASHLAVTRAALEHGKHVFSEKPLGTDLEEARAILELARERSLVVACAPDTFLWNGFQDALRLIRDGGVGDIVFARCEAVLAGPEAWHPRPQFLYAQGAGPLFDIGPYYLTALTVALGPVVRVRAVGTSKSPTRTIGSGPDAGTIFPVEVPTLTTAILEFASGVSATVLLTFDSASHRGGSLEILGTEATLRTSDPNVHDGATSILTAGADSWREVPLGSSGGIRTAGLVSLARYLRGTEPLRSGADLAFHVLEVMLAIERASSGADVVSIRSTYITPELLPVDWNLAAPVPTIA
ncbi:Gfo/Idh/MocA family oxidoreductase [Microbacteriaceae bacterium VKM Ac-2854]|nr:Gfo/Idh/MocA family oxidoreductase [Microbacteriaceae bacterium VKM Ac-2854]